MRGKHFSVRYAGFVAFVSVLVFAAAWITEDLCEGRCGLATFAGMVALIFATASIYWLVGTVIYHLRRDGARHSGKESHREFDQRGQGKLARDLDERMKKAHLSCKGLGELAALNESKIRKDYDE